MFYIFIAVIQILLKIFVNKLQCISNYMQYCSLKKTAAIFHIWYHFLNLCYLVIKIVEEFSLFAKTGLSGFVLISSDYFEGYKYISVLGSILNFQNPPSLF